MGQDVDGDVRFEVTWTQIRRTEFYLASYTDLAGNTELAGTRAADSEDNGRLLFGVSWMIPAPDSLTILDTSTTLDPARVCDSGSDGCRAGSSVRND